MQKAQICPQLHHSNGTYKNPNSIILVIVDFMEIFMAIIAKIDIYLLFIFFIEAAYIVLFVY